MRKIIITGRLTAEPIKKDINGVANCEFVLVVKNFGEKPVDYIHVKSWRNDAVFASKYFHKGDNVLVMGTFEFERYQTKEGVDKKEMVVTSQELEFADGKKEHSQINEEREN